MCSFVNMEKQELHDAFLSDFSALLKKYNASFNLDFRSKDYSHKDVPTIEFEGVYEGDNHREYSILDLPSYLN